MWRACTQLLAVITVVLSSRHAGERQTPKPSSRELRIPAYRFRGCARGA